MSGLSLAVLLTLVTCSIPLQKVPSLQGDGTSQGVLSPHLLLFLAEQSELLGDAAILCVVFLNSLFCKSKNLPMSQGDNLQDSENSCTMAWIVEIGVVV